MTAIKIFFRRLKWWLTFIFWMVALVLYFLLAGIPLLLGALIPNRGIFSRRK